MWLSIKDLWRHNRILLVAFVTALSLAGFFGVKAASQMIYWADPAHQDQTIAGWMTPRYVGQSYQVPPAVIEDALQITRGLTPRRASLETLAIENDMSMDEMQASVDEAVARWRAANPRRDQ
jgi:hypothetical protein